MGYDPTAVVNSRGENMNAVEMITKIKLSDAKKQWYSTIAPYVLLSLNQIEPIDETLQNVESGKEAKSIETTLPKDVLEQAKNKVDNVVIATDKGSVKLDEKAINNLASSGICLQNLHKSDE